MPGLEDLYREIILDHYRSPRNRGELESPPAQRVEGFNPLCGDEIVVTLEVADGVVSDIKIAGTGVGADAVLCIVDTNVSAAGAGLHVATRGLTEFNVSRTGFGFRGAR